MRLSLVAAHGGSTREKCSPLYPVIKRMQARVILRSPRIADKELQYFQATCTFLCTQSRRPWVRCLRRILAYEVCQDVTFDELCATPLCASTDPGEFSKAFQPVKVVVGEKPYLIQGRSTYFGKCGKSRSEL